MEQLCTIRLPQPLAQAFQSLIRSLLSKSEADETFPMPRLETRRQSLIFRYKTRSADSSSSFADLLECLRSRSIRLPSFLTICNGSTRQLSI
jgi:hypothetical protein